MSKSILEILEIYLPPERFRNALNAKSLQLEMHYNIHTAMYETAKHIDHLKKHNS